MEVDTSTAQDEDSDGVRPLTAPEWNGLLAKTNYTLRISDGTPEGSWYFWTEQHHEGGSWWLYAQRFDWTSPQEVGTTTLKSALEGDTTTQLVYHSEHSGE